MNKKDLIAKLAEKTEFTKKDAEKALNALIDIVIEAVSNEDKVQLIGFGTFEARSRAARQVTNPQTKAKFMAPATTVPAFKAGQFFKKNVLDAANERAAAAAAAGKKAKKK